MKRPLFNRACVIGVGLIGSSVGRDLLARGICREVAGFDASAAHLRAALRAGAITRAARNKDEDLSQYDLIVLAVPVGAMPGAMRGAAARCGTRPLVVDVASTKAGVAALAERLFPAGNFVGCHPMAGTEQSGPGAGRAGLFDGKVCFVVPPKNAAKAAVARARALWRALGSRVRLVAPGEHDALVAWVSHLPHAAAFAVAAALAGAEKKMLPRGLDWNDAAGGGFRDTTRVAASSPALWAEIFADNARHVIRAAKACRGELDGMIAALESGDGAALKRTLERAAALRRRIKA